MTADEEPVYRGVLPRPVCDAVCGRELRDHFADQHIEATVGPQSALLVATGFEPLGLLCPHGIRWHAEPTGDQRAKWARDGVK